MTLRTNRGVTLTSLIIYVIGLVVVISLLGTVSNHFYSKVNKEAINQDSKEQCMNFLTYLTKDTNSDELNFIKTETNGTYLIMNFDNNIQHRYDYQNNNIYYTSIVNSEVEKTIMLCKAVQSNGKVFDYQDGNLSINFKMDNGNFSKTLKVNI